MRFESRTNIFCHLSEKAPSWKNNINGLNVVSTKWKKGQSGNPLGQSSLAQNKRRLAADLLSHLLPRAAQVYAEMLEEKANKGFAAKEIFDRCLGKPPQAVEVTDSEGNSLIPAITVNVNQPKS